MDKDEDWEKREVGVNTLVFIAEYFAFFDSAFVNRVKNGPLNASFVFRGHFVRCASDEVILLQENYFLG